jgi:transposase
MNRKFREWQPDASWLFPPSPRDWLPEGHLADCLLDVTARIDISPIVEDYGGDNGGQPPFHPRMMLVLLLYAYSVGVFSSRKIMQRCATDIAFRVIVGEDIPNFRRIAEFRARHLKHLQSLFLEVLVLCREAGLLKVGRLSLDGTKIKANASRNKAMSYDRMGPKSQRNFTDPESKIMKTSNKGFDQCGNAQAVANDQQIIIADDVTDQANDVRQTVPMTDQLIANLDDVGVTENIRAFSADTGYFSEENMNALDSNERIDDVFIATGRLKHNDKVPDSPKGRPPGNLTAKQKMARRNRTKKGRAEYARRKVIIEPVFGQIKECLGFRNFLLRGLAKMKGEWKLVCLTHNLLKLFRSGALATS